MNVLHMRCMGREFMFSVHDGHTIVLIKMLLRHDIYILFPTLNSRALHFRYC